MPCEYTPFIATRKIAFSANNKLRVKQMDGNLNGDFSGLGYYPALQALLGGDSEGKSFFLSLPEEQQQELLNAKGDFEENLRILREKE